MLVPRRGAALIAVVAEQLAADDHETQHPSHHEPRDRHVTSAQVKPDPELASHRCCGEVQHLKPG